MKHISNGVDWRGVQPEWCMMVLLKSYSDTLAFSAVSDTLAEPKYTISTVNKTQPQSRRLVRHTPCEDYHQKNLCQFFGNSSLL